MQLANDIFEPFDVTYTAVTNDMRAFAAGLHDPPSRAWLQGLICGFLDERAHWDDGQFSEYRAAVAELNPRYLRLVAGAFLHISYDLPRAMADRWPAAGGGISEAQAAALYLDLSPVFPNVLRRVSRDRRVMGRFLGQLGRFPWVREILETASLWMMYLRTVAWVHAGLLRHAADRAATEAAMLEAMTRALAGVKTWKPWSVGVLKPPGIVDGLPAAVILFGLDVGDAAVAALAGLALFSIPLLRVARHTGEFRLFVDEFGRRIVEEVGAALRTGQGPPPDSTSSPPPPPSPPDGPVWKSETDRDLAAEPLLPIQDIQGDILVGLPKRHEHLIFFEITNKQKFKSFLKTLDVTSVQECLDKRATIAANKARGDKRLISTPGLNIAFTFDGLEVLSVTGSPSLPNLEAFRQGMAVRQAALQDPPAASWKILQPNRRLHGVFVLTGASYAEVVDVISLRLAPAADNGWTMLHQEIGQVRPDPVKGHEHFGYADGVSQPGVRGRVGIEAPLTPTTGSDKTQGARGQDLLWPGEFVFGYPGQDPAATSFEVKGPHKVPPIPFMKDGAFLVFRRLAQLVPEFNASIKQAAASIGGGSDKVSPELLGAQMVGRWKSGAPIITAPTADNAGLAEGTLGVNDFEFDQDRMGLSCPWAAHIRKAYPRDDVRHNTNPDDETIRRAEAFTQTHRMLRRGITFGPELTGGEVLAQQSAGGAQTRGLLFKCYVTSIEQQFEFVQQQWSNNGEFSQPGSGIDPIIGQFATEFRPFLGSAPFSKDPARKPELNLKSFVHLEGGAYFFAPSISAMRGL